jgi:hypothetical protein
MLANLVRYLPEIFDNATFSRVIWIYNLWQKLFEDLSKEFKFLEFSDTLTDAMYEELKHEAESATKSGATLLSMHNTYCLKAYTVCIFSN